MHFDIFWYITLLNLISCRQALSPKNAASNTEQVLEAAPNKAAAVRPPTTYHEKISKLDEPDMRDTAGEVGTSSLVMYSYGPLHMAKQKQGNQLKPIYSSSVRIQGVALRTCQKQWMIGKGDERESGISVLMAQQDDDDDDDDESY